MSAPAAPVAASAIPTTPYETALALAALGIPITPVHNVTNGVCSCGDPHTSKAKPPTSRGKEPRLNNWHKLASTDAPTIRSWERQNPGTNYGLVTGNRLLDVETDPGKGGDEWEQENGHRCPPTVMWRSGSGGLHRLYHVPDGVRTRTASNTFGPGADSRGDKNGQSVVPTSSHYSGNSPQWVPGHSPWEIEIADAPAWITEMAREHEQPSGPPAPLAGGTSTISDSDLQAWAEKGRTSGPLWRGNIPADCSHSETDFRLVRRLLWRNGGDQAQADRVFRNSGLYRSDKWDSRRGHSTYGAITIEKALISLNGQRYEDRRAAARTAMQEQLRRQPTPIRPDVAVKIDQALANGTEGQALDPATGELYTAGDLLTLLLEARAQIADLETENATLQARLGDMQAAISSKAVPGDKLAALGVQRVLAERGITHETAITVNLSDIVPAAAIAGGISEDTVTRFIGKQHRAGRLTRTVKRDPYITREGQRQWGSSSYAAFAPEFFDWDTLASPPGKEGETYGGARAKKCPECGSEDTQIVQVKRQCKCCGTVYIANGTSPESQKPQIAVSTDSAQQQPIENADCGVNIKTQQIAFSMPAVEPRPKVRSIGQADYLTRADRTPERRAEAMTRLNQARYTPQEAPATLPAKCTCGRNLCGYPVIGCAYFDLPPETQALVIVESVAPQATGQNVSAA